VKYIEWMCDLHSYTITAMARDRTGELPPRAPVAIPAPWSASGDQLQLQARFQGELGHSNRHSGVLASFAQDLD